MVYYIQIEVFLEHPVFQYLSEYVSKCLSIASLYIFLVNVKQV